MPVHFPAAFPLSSPEIARALDRLRTPDDERAKFYVATYPALLSATARLDELCSDCDVALGHMAYGWMPTALKRLTFSDHLAGHRTFIQRVKGVRCCSDRNLFLESIAEPPVNGSWVGTSKALHFVRPKMFPIWDSRIAAIFGAKHNVQIENGAHYQSYVKRVDEWALQMTTEVRAVVEAIGYDVSEVRAIEMLLFAHRRV